MRNWRPGQVGTPGRAASLFFIHAPSPGPTLESGSRSSGTELRMLDKETGLRCALCTDCKAGKR